MCKMLEEMRNEVEVETARAIAERLLKMGKLSLEEIAEGTGLSLEEVKELEAEVGAVSLIFLL